MTLLVGDDVLLRNEPVVIGQQLLRRVVGTAAGRLETVDERPREVPAERLPWVNPKILFHAINRCSTGCSGPGSQPLPK